MPLGLPSGGGKDLYLTNQIQLISRNSRKLIDPGGKGLHLVGRMLVAPCRQPLVYWVRQA